MAMQEKSAEYTVRVETGSTGRWGLKLDSIWVRRITGIALALLCALGVFLQDPKPDALKRYQMTEFGWWYYPIERNSWARLPVIEGRLRDLAVSADGSVVMAVGDAGLIIRSEDGGRSWVQQSLTSDKRASLYRPKAKRFAGWRIIRAASAAGPAEAPPEQRTAPFVPNQRNFGADKGNSGAGDRVVPRVEQNIDQSRTPRVTRGPNLRQEGPPTSETNITSPILTNIWVSEDGQAVGVGGSFRGYYRSENGGRSWKLSFRPIAFRALSKTQLPEALEIARIKPDFVSTRIASRNDSYRWAFSEDGLIVHSRDSGKSWVPQTMGPAYRTAFLDQLSGEEGRYKWEGKLKIRNGAESEENDKNKDTKNRSTGDSSKQSGGEQSSSGPATNAGNTESTSGKKNQWKDDNSTHWVLPAPWFFIGLLISAGLLFPTARPVPAKRAEAASISNEYASDRPLGENDPDPWNFKSIAEGVSAFLRNENTEPPLSIAITGPWGTGKSSLMNLICSDLRNNRYRPVWFNAWHHQKEEHLLAALLENILAGAIPPWWTPAGWIYRGRLMWIRIKRNPIIACLVIAISLFGLGVFIGFPDARWQRLLDHIANPDVGSTYAKLLGGSSLISFFVAIGGFWAGTRNRLGALGMKPASLLSSLSGRMSKKDLRAQLGFRHRFSAEFRDVSEALKPVNIVIVIDDLDRCRPENVLEVLEAVNFLVSSGDCYVILGMDCQWAERCIGEAYKDIADHPTEDELSGGNSKDGSTSSDEVIKLQRRTEFAQRYLQKLINIEIPVPRIEPGDSALIASRATADPGEGETGFGWDLKAIGRKILIWGMFAVASIGLLYLGTQAAKVPVIIEQAKTGDAAAPAGTPGQSQGGTTRIGTLHSSSEAQILGWLVFVPAGLLLFLFGLVFYEQYKRKLSMVVQDTPDFEKALGAWAPLVFSRDKTPRGVKRFLNRVRYFAMRRRLSDTQGSEANIVALAALHHCFAGSSVDELLKVFRTINDGELDRDVWGRVTEEEGGLLNQALNFSKSLNDWPPDEQEIRQFHDWARWITVR